jgi:hypothetical protein
MSFLLYGLLAFAVVLLLVKLLDLLSALIGIGVALVIIFAIAGTDAYVNLQRVRSFAPQVTVSEYTRRALSKKAFHVVPEFRQALEEASKAARDIRLPDMRTR